MERITLVKCEDGAIWVTSDENEIGSESYFDKIKDENKQMLIALAEFLGYEPSSVLAFDDEFDDEFEDEEAMIRNATYTSVWECGYTITTNCKVNTETKEVFDIEVSDIDVDDMLEEEYVTIDGKDYPVSCNGEDDTEYWYE